MVDQKQEQRRISKTARIYVAGHRGMVGSAILRELQNQGYENLILRTHEELPLDRQKAVEEFFAQERPEVVFLAAARVGGILANASAPADFLYENLMMELNTIHQAAEQGCQKLIFLGSSCIYPREATQPIREESILTGPLEKTNEAYALAKISGLKYGSYLRQQHGTDVISIMPCNLYGPGDNYDPQTSHVLPAMIRRFHEAKEEGRSTVTCWGDGTPLREFLHVDDLARFLVLAMERCSQEAPINAGSGEEISIRELAKLIAEIVGYEGEICWDPAGPNGTMRKVLDSGKARALGWTPQVSLRDGIALAYQDFLGMR